MSSGINDMDQLRARIRKAVATGKKVRTEDSGQELKAGQIWSVANLEEDAPAWCFLLLEDIKGGLWNAVPVFRWGELAGPEDVRVPARLAGADMIVSFEVEATIDRSMLSTCHGRLPEAAMAYVSNAADARLDEDARIGYAWGPDCLGDWEPRAKYHKAIAAKIEDLQTTVRESVWAEEPAGKLIAPPFSFWRTPFEVFEMPAAAADGEKVSACLVVSAGQDGAARSLALFNLSFDTLNSGRNEDICCEWEAREVIASAQWAWVYAPDCKEAIGRARVIQREGEMLVQLTSAHLPADADPISDSSKLRFVMECEG